MNPFANENEKKEICMKSAVTFLCSICFAQNYVKFNPI